MQSREQWWIDAFALRACIKPRECPVLPLDDGGRLPRDVVDHPVDPARLVDDAVHDH
jgi:hypothetical protein